jgi:hypothetical protein
LRGGRTLVIPRIEQDEHYCGLFNILQLGSSVAQSVVRQSTLARLDTTQASTELEQNSINVDCATSTSTPLMVVEATYERYAMYGQERTVGFQARLLSMIEVCESRPQTRTLVLRRQILVRCVGFLVRLVVA